MKLLDGTEWLGVGELRAGDVVQTCTVAYGVPHKSLTVKSVERREVACFSVTWEENVPPWAIIPGLPDNWNGGGPFTVLKRGPSLLEIITC